MNKAESCVETPAAPEWLSKLESRREKLAKAKLGHEVGAGAPCNECGDKCPGLDLHFWRKVCRNCKCRKDQHSCTDDDLSGWAQFEILGQIRSKPAYIKIKALAEQPVKVDWVPPNATLDVVSDYMNKLGSTHIPVAGSDAAAKRKQQLEFQVPPHDLDARLCDNLSESETAQLQQYVEKIRENCVGQGNVVRIGNEICKVTKPQISTQINEEPRLSTKHLPAELLRNLNITPALLVKDKILMNILNSEKLTNALMSPQRASPLLIAFSKPIQGPLTPIYANITKTGNPDKLNDFNLNKETVKSLIENGPVYEKIIADLETKGIDYSKDPVLQTISEFRKKYLNDDKFKQDMERYVKLLSTPYSSPIKSYPLNTADILNSPLPLKTPINPKIGVIIKQDTPMRKVKFGGVNIAYLLGLPIEANIEKDKLLSTIVNSEPIRNILQQNSSKLPSNSNLIISNDPLVTTSGEFIDSGLTIPTKNKIHEMGLNKYAVQSGVINGSMYDQLFSNLKARGVDYANCKLLAPMEQFRQEFINNVPFQKEIIAFIESIPNSYNIALSEPISNAATAAYSTNINTTGPFSNPQSPFKLNLHNSKSTDSGFESKPPTPNYATFPGALPPDAQQQMLPSHNSRNVGVNSHPVDIDAMKGRFSSIPGIEDMNMYPLVEPPFIPLESINDDLSNLNLSQNNPDQFEINQSPIPVLKCKDCTKDIWTGEVAVKAERAGKDSAWHPECFKCYKCRELLADLVYFFHGGNVYCGRDLAIILEIPRCNACDELIFTKNYTMAEGATFHIKHFCCYQCDTPLAGQQYVPDEKTNMPLCLNCYNEYYAERCEFCKMIIGPAEQGVAWGKVHWHGHCFNCQGQGCGKSLLGGRFCIKSNMPFCSPQCVKSVIF